MFLGKALAWLGNRGRTAGRGVRAARQRRLLLESLECRAVPAVFSVTSVADSGPGSLRSALDSANNSAGLDTINFNIGGSGVHTITLASELPQILDATLIDGWSQPGATFAPVIEISAGSSAAEYGFSVFGSNSTIRGLTLGGFTSAAIALWDADNVRVQGNYLGTNAAGSAVVGNSIYGSVYITENGGDGAHNNIIGTNGDGVADAREANVIGGSNQAGVWITGTGSDHNRVAGNYIGTNASGDNLANRWGVYVSGGAKSNFIGSNLDGVADGIEGNTIAKNTSAGVAIVDSTSTGNQISRNKIFGNAGLDIDLGDDGLTPNDAGDIDGGPNTRLNFPVVQTLNVSSNAIAASGQFSGAASAAYRLEFFASSTTNPSGSGGAERYLGTTNLTTNSSGAAPFSALFGGTLDYGWVVSVTATDAVGNTSEFSPAAWQGMSLANTFALHSQSTATKRIYLDFNGQTVTNTLWNSSYNRPTIEVPAYSLDSSSTFNDQELTRIQRIYQRVAEDFRPFDIDITTQEPIPSDLIDTGDNDTRWGVRVIIGGYSMDVLGADVGGGISYIGDFTWNNDTPSFVFPGALNLGAEHDVALAISHEAGHSLGLHHDGSSADGEYFLGHGSGATSWGAIMGAPYGRAVTQWSKGDYIGATNTEDDLAIITQINGFSYRTDAVGDTIAAAAQLKITSQSAGVGKAFSQGVIEQNTDLDVFSFDMPAGLIDLSILPDQFDPNLDIQAELLDANGMVLQTSNPANTLSARLTGTFSAGRYYVRIDGVGVGDPLNQDSGYTDYGSLGMYTIAGRLPHDNVAPAIAGVSGIGSYVENATPTVVAQNGLIAERDSVNFAGGWLSVRTVTNPSLDDRLSLRNQGNAAGQIGIVGNQIRFGGVLVGTFSGGNSDNALSILLNVNCTPGAAQAILRNITFQTLGDTPSVARRAIQIKMSDGDGAVSNTVYRYLDVVAQNDPPTVFVGSDLGYRLGAAPITLAAFASVNDPDSANFAGGQLTMHIAAGASSSNLLSIGGGFYFGGQDIYLAGTRIGRKITADGGQGTVDLVISLSPNATVVNVQQLLRAIRFSTTAGASAGARTIEFMLSDGDGGTSPLVSKSVYATN